MKVLHVLEAVEGGAALSVRYLAAEQARRGMTVALAVPVNRSWGRTDSELPAYLSDRGVEVLPLGMRRTPIHPANIAATLRLLRFTRSWRPDVIHTHATTGGVLGRIVAAIRRTPRVHTYQGMIFADPGAGARGAASRLLERSLRPITGAVIAVSASEAQVLRTVHAPERVALVPNGIPSDDSPPAEFPDPPLVVSVSRFEYPKDPLLAVRVMAAARRSVPGSRALVIGYGRLEDEVRRLVAELDPGIEVRSDIPGPEAVAAASVVLLCTRREGGPYVALEAMERSRPVVTTDVVGARDAVADGETGFLFGLGDVDRGADAVARLLAEPSTAARMGEAGRVRFTERFSLDSGVSKVSDLYRELVDGRPGASPL